MVTLDPMRKAITTAALLAATTIALTGCSSAAPTDDEIRERFTIETKSALPTTSDAEIDRLVNVLAPEAAEHCNDYDFWSRASSTGTATSWPVEFKYVWAASCSVLYDNLDTKLEAEYARTVGEQAAD